MSIWKGELPQISGTLFRRRLSQRRKSNLLAAWRIQHLHGGNKLCDRFEMTGMTGMTGIWASTLTQKMTLWITDITRYGYLSSIVWLQSDTSTFCTLGHVPRRAHRAPFPPEAFVARCGFHLAGVRARHEIYEMPKYRKGQHGNCQKGSKIPKAEAVQNQKHAFFVSQFLLSANWFRAQWARDAKKTMSNERQT